MGKKYISFARNRGLYWRWPRNVTRVHVPFKDALWGPDPWAPPLTSREVRTELVPYPSRLSSVMRDAEAISCHGEQLRQDILATKYRLDTDRDAQRARSEKFQFRREGRIDPNRRDLTR